MLALALVLNCAIVLPVTRALWAGSSRMDEAFGPDTEARRILACVYGAIGLVSLWGLWQLSLNGTEAAWTVALPLFCLQILYKLGSVPAVGLHNPVVLTNLFVVVILLLAIWLR